VANCGVLVLDEKCVVALSLHHLPRPLHPRSLAAYREIHKEFDAVVARLLLSPSKVVP
jgi:hypothetical protein